MSVSLQPRSDVICMNAETPTSRIFHGIKASRRAVLQLCVDRIADLIAARLNSSRRILERHRLSFASGNGGSVFRSGKRGRFACGLGGWFLNGILFGGVISGFPDWLPGWLFWLLRNRLVGWLRNRIVSRICNRLVSRLARFFASGLRPTASASNRNLSPAEPSFILRPGLASGRRGLHFLLFRIRILHIRLLRIRVLRFFTSWLQVSRLKQLLPALQCIWTLIALRISCQPRLNIFASSNRSLSVRPSHRMNVPANAVDLRKRSANNLMPAISYQVLSLSRFQRASLLLGNNLAVAELLSCASPLHSVSESPLLLVLGINAIVQVISNTIRASLRIARLHVASVARPLRRISSTTGTANFLPAGRSNLFASSSRLRTTTSLAATTTRATPTTTSRRKFAVICSLVLALIKLALASTADNSAANASTASNATRTRTASLDHVIAPHLASDYVAATNTLRQLVSVPATATLPPIVATPIANLPPFDRLWRLQHDRLRRLFKPGNHLRKLSIPRRAIGHFSQRLNRAVKVANRFDVENRHL